MRAHCQSSTAQLLSPGLTSGMRLPPSQHCRATPAHLLQLLCTRTAQVQPRGLLLQRLGQIEAQGGLLFYFHRAPGLFRSQLLR